MRYLAMLAAGLSIAVATIMLPSADVSYAAFHCMRIHAVKAGFGGNASIQYVELRMDAAGQPFVGGHTIQFFDGGGALKATFTFPANVTNSATGESILVATSEFNTAASGGAADFTFSNANTTGSNGGDPLHPVQAPNGKVVFAPATANCVATVPVDSIAAGTATADFGTAAVALPAASDARALRLSNLNTAPSNNSTEYSLQAVSTTSFAVAQANLPSDFSTPRNNARMVLKLTAPAASVGGVAELPQLTTSTSAEAARVTSRWLLAAGAAAAIAAAGAAGVVLRRRRARP